MSSLPPMGCDSETNDTVDADEVARLFAEIDVVGAGALHPIEQEILAGLRVRPPRTWCRAQRLMLLGLHAKVHGRPFTALLLGR